MVVYNYSGKEINAKIVYYGPALSGKTTNLEWIYSKIPVEYSGKMVSLRTQADRTIFFDFLPLDLGMIDGFRTRFMLYTVPGQVHYNATRKMVLKGVDGLVFVADSEPSRMQDNIESLRNLRDNLEELGLNPDTLPLVMQWNKRDLPNCMSVSELERELNPNALPSFEACALTGEGVYETLHKASRLIYANLTGDQPSFGDDGADQSLFGESIAQCLQDIDVPQPEPERVAVATDSMPVRRDLNASDALGAILGGHFGSAEDAPLEEAPALEDAPAPHEERAPFAAAAEASDLGGLVDEVLDSLKNTTEIASVDRGNSRRQEAFAGDQGPSTSAGPTPEPVQELPGNLSEGLDAFFEAAESRSEILGRVSAEGRQAAWGSSQAVAPPPPAPPVASSSERASSPEPTSPANSFEIEHDTDVFETLNSGQLRAVTPPTGGSGLDIESMIDAERAREQGEEKLDLITDPRKLKSDSRPVTTISGLSGTSPSGSVSRVLEVPVTLDSSTLEEGGTIRIVLNVSVKR